jgi:hypothetical protein
MMVVGGWIVTWMGVYRAESMEVWAWEVGAIRIAKLDRAAQEDPSIDSSAF